MNIYIYIYIIYIYTYTYRSLTSATWAPVLRNTGLAFTRDCHRQYCMVYGIQKGDRWGGVYCEMSVQ